MVQENDAEYSDSEDNTSSSELGVHNSDLDLIKIDGSQKVKKAANENRGL